MCGSFPAMPPKSLLKKPANTFVPPSSKPVNERHLQTALRHANIIEAQKQIESEILRSIITLLDFPSSNEATAAQPSPNDAARFQDMLVPFQPSDYDALIEERNAAKKCGYALCPKPQRRAPSSAKRQFVNTDHGPEIVEKKVLEMWCSDDCAWRALHVKVQLLDEPAWLRRGGVNDKIDLKVDNKEAHQEVLPIRLKSEQKLSVPDAREEEDDFDEEAAWAIADEALAELATERGEQLGKAHKATEELIKDRIQERTDNGPPTAPSLSNTNPEQAHFAVEGHVPKANVKKSQRDDGDGVNDDKDWNI